MKGVVADADFEGQLQRLVDIWNTSEWGPFWSGLRIHVVTFADLGLAKSASDQLVWRTCQSREIVLVTGNRNLDDPTSLEATIRNESRADSLPVFTVSKVDQVFEDRDYAHRVAVDLLEYLIEIRDNPESILGSGRIYLPKPVKT